jgi:hypothetical protein
MRLVLTFLLAGAVVASCMQKKGGSRMQEIPTEVREYLTAGDGLARKAVQAQHPDIKEKLQSPEMRVKLLQYLAGEEPWQDADPGLAINALGVVQTGAKAEETASIRPLLMHREGMVRLGAYQFLMAVYYPAGERGSMLTLFQAMLLDPEAMVRAQAAQFIRGLKMHAPLKPFLERWVKLAPARGWDKDDSFEVVRSMLTASQ